MPQELQFREATPEERKIFYSEEWRGEDIPEFLRSSIKFREFGFDHRGEGPNDRYNRFGSLAELERYLKARAPYSAYSSVSYYDRPERREGYIKAELVFDIDAKDLPVKGCCGAGNVCEKCLKNAKEIVLSIKDVLEEDLGIRETHYVYSGRGYHIRIIEEDIMKFGDAERGYILDYLSGSETLKRTPKKNYWLANRGYAKIFRTRIAAMLREARKEDFLNIGIDEKTASQLIRKREDIIKEVSEGVIGQSNISLVEPILKMNASLLDAKVTVDVKRILRLPSSLHSKVSMKCMEIKNLETFDPLKEAVPRFLKERKEQK